MTILPRATSLGKSLLVRILWAARRPPPPGDSRPKEIAMTEPAPSAAEPIRRPEHSNAYNIFILVLTILSLAIMVLLVLPIPDNVYQVLWVYDNLICIVFLGDFAFNMSMSRPKREYFIHQRGWLDLLGSIPSFGILRLTALLRLARLSRLARISRLLRGKNKTALIEDVVDNRSQYAVFITLLAGMLVLVASSVLVLEFETVMAPVAGKTPNITTGGDALWWSFVTITTVGYGDYYPVTQLGRIVGIFVMFSGVGIIGALASILASVLVPDPEPDGPETPPAETATATATRSSVVPAGTASVASAGSAAVSPTVETELASLRAEIAALRQALVTDGRGATG
jgi:voltage-gated potassium channel